MSNGGFGNSAEAFLLVGVISMFRAVIFDFDGVIADSEPLHFEAFRQVLAGRGLELSREIYYSQYLGFSDVDCIKEFERNFELDLGQSGRDELMLQKGVVFDELAAKSNTIIDGAGEFIGMLGANNIPMAICSGALLHEIEQVLDKCDFSDAFEVIVAAEHVSKGKPDPEGYFMALDQLKEQKKTEIDFSECVVIEDSRWGLQAARAAGMHAVGVTNTYSEAELAEYAEITVAKLGDISIDSLQKLCA